MNPDTKNAIEMWKAIKDESKDWVFQALMEASDAAFDGANDEQAKAFDVVSALLRTIS